MIDDKTMNFEVERDNSIKAREILKEVYEALSEKGYNPVNQIVGYILSGDPTYITSYKNARGKIAAFDSIPTLPISTFIFLPAIFLSSILLI